MATAPDPFAEIREAAMRFSVGMEIIAEADRSARLHDNTDLIDGSGHGVGTDLVRDLHSRALLRLASMADIARERCQAYSHTDEDSWMGVLAEEFFEAIEEEPGTQALRGELVQVAAVCLNWIRSIDERTPEIDEEES